MGNRQSAIVPVRSLPLAALNRRVSPCLRAFVASCLVVTTTALAQSGGGYVIKKSTVDAGGHSNLTGGAYKLGGSVGQPDAANLSGGGYTLTGGFWAPTSPCAIAAAAIAETILDSSGLTVPSVKNRFLSFSVGAPGLQRAVRVKFVSLPGAFGILNGTSRWVDTPFTASELPSKNLADPVGTEASFMAAKLSTTPVFNDWSTFGMVHVYDERIIPSRKQPALPLEPAIYWIQITCEACDPNVEASYSPPLVIQNPRWGDLTALAGNPAQFRAPDGIVSVTDDVIGLLNKFGGAVGAPIKARAEMQGVGAGGPASLVNGKIEIGDALAVLGAFSGGSYPFPPPAP